MINTPEQPDSGYREVTVEAGDYEAGVACEKVEYPTLRYCRGP